MKPIVNGLKTEFNDQIIVQRLDAVESGNATLMQEYGVRGHPSFVLLGENGRVIQTFFRSPRRRNLENDHTKQFTLSWSYQ